MAEPVLEESYYWRAVSYNALGNQPRAITDLRTSLEYHPGALQHRSAQATWCYF